MEKYEAQVSVYDPVQLFVGVGIFSILIMGSAGVAAASEEPPLEFFLVAALAIPLMAYQAFSLLMNEWTIVATPERVQSSIGPVPSFDSGLSVQASRIEAVLATTGKKSVRPGRFDLFTNYSIELLHKNAETTELISGCTDRAEVERVRKELEDFLGLAPPLTDAEKAVQGI